MKIFTLSSASMQNVTTGYEHNIWAFPPRDNKGSNTRLRNTCATIEVGDLFLLYCSEVGSFVMMGHVSHRPMHDAYLGDLWDGEFCHPIPMAWWNAPQCLSKEQFLLEMPLFKRIGPIKTWQIKLNLNPLNFGRPCPMGMDDLCYLIDSLKANPSDEHLQAVFDYQQPIERTVIQKRNPTPRQRRNPSREERIVQISVAGGASA